jgi:hypothetical protein
MKARSSYASGADICEYAIPSGVIAIFVSNKSLTMQIINRSAISVSARKALIDWVNTVDPENIIVYSEPSDYDEATVYLIEELDSEDDFQDWIRENYQEIFEEELFSWIMDDSKWPEPLTFELFTQWFQVTHQSMVFDFNDSEPLEYEEDTA